jgi:hypothetical protein
VPLNLDREQILAYRRRVGGLDGREPKTDDSLRRAAWAGLSDSTPRSAVLSIHARVAATAPSDWEHPALVQLWGLRFSVYVVHHEDRAVFSLGRWPADRTRQQYAVQLADRLEAFLGDRVAPYGEAGRALGVHPSQLRYAAMTGRVLIRWDGARQPTVRMAPPPAIGPDEARRELMRRYFHVLGPGTPEGFAAWAGLYLSSTRPAFAEMGGEMTPVRTPVGEAWILASDEPSFRRNADAPPDAGDAAVVRLLPTGDAYYLLHGRERELLVPDAAERAALWTSRVWPGALLVDGDVVGTWRRADQTVTVGLWRPLAAGLRDVIEQEASGLPVPRTGGAPRVRWEGAASSS